MLQRMPHTNRRARSSRLAWGALCGSALLFLAAPALLYAADFPQINRDPSFNKVTLTANGAAKATAVTPGTVIKLAWNAPGAKGCVSNWNPNASLPANNGSEEGTVSIPSGKSSVTRVFTIVCYGVGAAKGAAVRVTVGQPDLAVTRLSFKGQRRQALPSDTAEEKRVPRYLPSGFIVTAVVQNVGRATFVPTASPAKLSLLPDGGVTDKTLQRLAPGQSQTITHDYSAASTDNAKKWTLKFCVPPETEQNNCKTTSQFKFVAQ